MNTVNVLAPAKINLSLDVLGVDDRGYHLLDMVMQTISIFESITLTKQEKITISSNTRYIPTDERNSAVKAAIKFFEYTNIQGGVHIHVIKRIPIKAGMAGGSADAAGVLKGLDYMYQTKLSQQQLCEIGLMVGSDVPFMLIGGTKRVGGTGEVVETAPKCPNCWFVIGMPYDGVSTPEAFARYDKLNDKTLVQTDKLLQAMKNQNLNDMAQYIANDLEKAAQSKDTQPIKEKLIEHGAFGSVMTGSGAAVFGIFDSEEKAKIALEKIKPNLRSAFIAQPITFGASVRKNNNK